MNNLFEQLKRTPVLYVTRDIERALGLPADTEGFVIITNSTPFAKELVKSRGDIVLIEEDGLLDTWDLLRHEQVISYIHSISEAKILVFKNTKQIERTCAEHGWTLINPAASISDIVEPKISQVEWLGDLQRFLPPRRVSVCSDVYWDDTPFILQFNRSHTGSGTMLIESEAQLAAVQEKFPKRPVRISEYIHGPLITNNNCVTDSNVLIGNVSYQITGLAPFTDRPFATIGNDWKLPHALLTEAQYNQYTAMATAVGKKLQADGWRGLFGIDVVMDENSGELFLLEINCRQPASTTFESTLQQASTDTQQTIFVAHLCALLGIETEGPLVCIANGAQIILRNITHRTWDTAQLSDLKIELIHNGFFLTEYNNTEPGSDLLRIQSEEGFMSAHGIFGKRGALVCDIINSMESSN